jgi:hypothetical protein
MVVDDVPETGPILEVLQSDEGQIILVNGESMGRCHGLTSLAPVVGGLVAEIAINAHHFFLQLHAGAVVKEGRCTLLSGAPGSGKSTLTAALCAHGCQCLSDEVAILEDSTFRVPTVPLGITVKSGAVELLSEMYPHLSALPVHTRNDGQLVRYLTPPRSSLPEDLAASHPVERVVFPRYEPGLPTELRPIARSQGLQMLLDECVVIPERLTLEKVRSLVSWMRTVSCFSLSMSDLGSAVRLLK